MSVIYDDDEMSDEDREWLYEPLVESAKDGCLICRQPFKQSDNFVGDGDGLVAHVECATFDPYSTGDCVWDELPSDAVQAIRDSLPG